MPVKKRAKKQVSKQVSAVSFFVNFAFGRLYLGLFRQFCFSSLLFKSLFLRQNDCLRVVAKERGCKNGNPFSFSSFAAQSFRSDFGRMK